VAAFLVISFGVVALRKFQLYVDGQLEPLITENAGSLHLGGGTWVVGPEAASLPSLTVTRPAESVVTSRI